MTTNGSGSRSKGAGEGLHHPAPETGGDAGAGVFYGSSSHSSTYMGVVIDGTANDRV